MENFKILKNVLNEMWLLHGPVYYTLFLWHYIDSLRVVILSNTKLFSLYQMILNVFLINAKRISNVHTEYTNIHTEYNKCSTVFLKLDPN